MKKNILFFAVSTFLFSCGMPTKSDLIFENSSSTLNLDPEVKVSYEQIKKEILAPKCINCHGNAASEKGLNDWIIPGDPERSLFFLKSENGSMPKNGTPLSTKELELIKIYITQMGNASPVTPQPAPGSAPTPSPAPAPAPTGNPGVTYEEIKTNILQPYRCTSCHSVGTEKGLSRWINTANPSSSFFYTKTKSGFMPEGGPRVTPEDQALILQYVKDYAKRN